MKKLIIPFLLLIQCHVFAETYNIIKIFDRQSHIEAGIDFGCFFWWNPAEISSDFLFSNNNNQLELILSVNTIGLKRCSPLPPEFIDKGRYYYSLGKLQPGNYSLSVKYVLDESFPPEPSTTLHEYAQRTFQIAHPIPTLGTLGLTIVILMLLLFTQVKVFRKHKNRI